MAFQHTNRTGNIFPVHLDLRQRVPTSLLLRWAIESPQTVDLNWSDHLKASVGDFRPQMLLSLLSFCYAIGYYASEEIEEAIKTDRTMRYICARTYPDAKTIRRFRRNYRGALDQCLSHVLREAAFHMMDRDVMLLCEVDQQVISATQEKIELAVILDRFEGES
jgi:hypothetical protein